MAAIKGALQSKGGNPYENKLTLQVVATDEVLNYTNKDGQQRSSQACAASDGTDVVKVVCFDSSKFPKMKVGTTLIMRNLIPKTDTTPNYFVATANTRMVISVKPVDVPQIHTSIGTKLLNPPPSEQVPIAEALASPVKKKSSICGKIVQEDEPRTVVVKGEDVKIKTVTVSDPSGKTKVSLWRETATSSLRPGDHVTITDVVVNHYQNSVSLTTTGKSKIEKCDPPTIKMETQLEGYDQTDDLNMELYCSNDESVMVPKQMMENALAEANLDTSIESVTDSGPLMLNMMLCGNTVTSLTVSCPE